MSLKPIKGGDGRTRNAIVPNWFYKEEVEEWLGVALTHRDFRIISDLLDSRALRDEVEEKFTDYLYTNPQIHDFIASKEKLDDDELE